MKKFIVIYYAPFSAAEQMTDATPEEIQAGMEPWMTWAAKCGDGLLDMGAPLANGQKVTGVGTTPSDKMVVGYSVLQADSMEDAVEMLKGHPHLATADSCEIEVHETVALPGM